MQLKSKTIRLVKVLKWVADNPKEAFLIIEDHLAKKEVAVVFDSIQEDYIKKWEMN